MTTGTIHHVIADKGYGFIRRPGGGDIFFHMSDLADDLEFDEQLKEMPVEFELKQTERGFLAVDVRAI